MLDSIVLRKIIETIDINLKTAFSWRHIFSQLLYVVKNHRSNTDNSTYHIQNVNSYHSRIKSWIIHVFHRVATKYLNHYLWWKHVLEDSLD